MCYEIILNQNNNSLYYLIQPIEINYDSVSGICIVFLIFYDKSNYSITPLIVIGINSNEKL